MKYLSLILCLLVSATVFAANPKVLIETNKGQIEVELLEKESPISVKNFLAYVNEKHFDGLIFHRVIPRFMIQGGGFAPGMNKRNNNRAPIKNESKNGIDNTKGMRVDHTVHPEVLHPDRVGNPFFERLTQG